MTGSDFRILALGGACLLVVSGAAHAASVVLRTHTAGWDGEPIETTLVLLPAGDDPIQGPRMIPLEAPGEVRFDIPTESVWLASVRAPGFWAAEEVVLGVTDASVEIELLPAGEVAARIDTPGRQELRKPVELHFEASPTAPPGSPQVSGTVRCTRVEGPDRRVSCSLPAGVWDLHFHHPGFASVHRWDVVVTSHQTSTVVPLKLVPGSSLVGAIALEDAGARAFEAVKVRVLPLTRREEETRPGIDRRLRSLARSTVPNERGFFQLTDLEAGTYALQVRAPGYADLLRRPVRIFEGRESVLDQPMLLRRPVSLNLSVDPPVTPSGARWRVQLRSLDAVAGTSAEKLGGATSSAGLWTGKDLNPGRYLLTLQEGRSSKWWQEEVVIDVPEARLHVDLDPVEVQGDVTYGGDPVRARLVFGGLRASQEIEVSTDEDGRFQTSLPRPGVWRLAVQLSRGGPVQGVEPVEVDADGGWLDVAIEDRRLLGRVVDDEGQGVPGIQVQVVRLDGAGASRHDTSETITSEDGRFGFFGLPEGRYSVNMISALDSGPGVVLDLEGVGTREPIRLVLERPIRVAGRVISARGPVAGALVYLYPETPRPRRTPLRQWITDPTGSFEAMVPESTQTAALMVLAPGYAARSFRIAVKPDVPLEVRVDDIAGTVVVEVPPEDLPAARLFHESSPAWLAILKQWAQMHGISDTEPGRSVFPSMEFGAYRLCLDGRCDEGYLPPGGEVILRAPTPQSPTTPQGDTGQ